MNICNFLPLAFLFTVIVSCFPSHYDGKGRVVSTPNYLPYYSIHYYNVIMATYFEELDPRDKQTFWTRIFYESIPLKSRILRLMLLDIQRYMYIKSNYEFDVNILFNNLQEYLISSKNNEDETDQVSASDNVSYICIDPKLIFKPPQ